MTLANGLSNEAVLAQLTTLRLGGPADQLVTAHSTEKLVEILRSADAGGRPVMVLGGGSNVVVPDSGFRGLVVLVRSTGHQLEVRGRAEATLTVEAGEDWDAVVARTVDAGFGGLECLSGIPGTSGATLVQNVGAYGAEMADLLIDADLYDRRCGVVRPHVPAAELALGHRTSVLKSRPDLVVLRLRLRLREDGHSAPLRYAELAQTLGVAHGSRVAPTRVRDAVLALRRSKGMVLDPADHDTWSVGSFFANPVLDQPAAPPIAELPVWRLDQERVKVSAAWLIEHAGFHRGHLAPGGRVGLSTKHALALTNRGNGTTAELLALARTIRDAVRARFEVDLAPEPTLVHCVL